MASRRSAPPPMGEVRRRLAQLGQRPQKRLGQHFLSDRYVAERIVDLARVEAGVPVVEIGPGLGVLSDLLAPRCSRLLLIELDPGLAEDLRRRYGDTPAVEVIHADAARADFAALLAGQPPAIGIGNLPYNAATAILAHMLEQRQCFRRLVFMLQREVAERLAAAPGSRAYGSLTVLTQIYCDVHMVLPVGPGAFVPRPQVDSMVALLEVLPEPRVATAAIPRLRRLVRGIFTHRRKQLRNAARGLLRDPDAALRAAGIDPMRRPETLSIEELARLASQEP